MDEAHINKVLETYAARAEIEKYSHRASPEEIAENDFNLNIPPLRRHLRAGGGN